MQILGSHFCSKYIVEGFTEDAIKSNYQAGVINYSWTFLSEIVLFLGITIGFWITRLAPVGLSLIILKSGRFLDLYFGDVYKYNFHENFFFFNVGAWFIYTFFTWKFKNFKEWYTICILLHFTIICLYCSWSTLNNLFK